MMNYALWFSSCQSVLFVGNSGHKIQTKTPQGQKGHSGPRKKSNWIQCCETREHFSQNVFFLQKMFYLGKMHNSKPFQLEQLNNWVSPVSDFWMFYPDRPDHNVIQPAGVRGLIATLCGNHNPCPQTGFCQMRN